jgi:patatin-like phospholipase/acyl hydrolase
MINEALVELCIVSYSVTRQEARMYSKYLAHAEPDVYNMRLFDAAAATSSAPLYWELKETTLPDNSTEVLIDGGVVMNNPSIYAQSLALIERMNS